MSETDVVEAFLSHETGEKQPLSTDGERLCIGSQVIAEWYAAGLIVTQENQGELHERIKDRLVHRVLLRMAGQQRAVESRRILADVSVT